MSSSNERRASRAPIIEPADRLMVSSDSRPGAGADTRPNTLLDITPDTSPITVAGTFAGPGVASETLVLLRVRARVPGRVGRMGHSALDV